MDYPRLTSNLSTFPISASQVSRITGVSHRWRLKTDTFDAGLLLLSPCATLQFSLPSICQDSSVGSCLRFTSSLSQGYRSEKEMKAYAFPLADCVTLNKYF
jgi:hypothetical protein